MPKVDIDTVKERLKADIRDFIKKNELGSKKSSGLTEVYFLEAPSGKLSRKTVLKPSRALAIEEVENEKESSFYDTATWLYESGNAYEKALFDDGGEPIKNPAKEQLIPFYRREIKQFAGQVMDYSGGFTVTDEAFERAFKDNFLEKYKKTTPYKVLIPLLNFDGPDKTIKLDANIEFELDNKLTAKLKSIEISPFTSSELSGIYNFEKSMMLIGGPRLPQGFHSLSHKVQLEVKSEIKSHGGLESKIISRVSTILRLFKESSGELNTGAHYHLNPNWMNYREDVKHVDSASGSPSIGSNLGGKNYEFTSDDVSDLQLFWDEYKNQVKREKSDNLAIAIRRFNQTYQKERSEGKIVDCVIALEATILKKLNQTESYRYRLPLRASLLLSNNSNYKRDFIYSFFKRLYDVRSKIVHMGKEMEEVNVQEETFSIGEFAMKTRNFLRVMIIRYLEGESDNLCVQDVNKKLDMAARKAQCNLDFINNNE